VEAAVKKKKRYQEEKIYSHRDPRQVFWIEKAEEYNMQKRSTKNGNPVGKNWKKEVTIIAETSHGGVVPGAGQNRREKTRAKKAQWQVARRTKEKGRGVSHKLVWESENNNHMKKVCRGGTSGHFNGGGKIRWKSEGKLGSEGPMSAGGTCITVPFQAGHKEKTSQSHLRKQKAGEGKPTAKNLTYQKPEATKRKVRANGSPAQVCKVMGSVARCDVGDRRKKKIYKKTSRAQWNSAKQGDLSFPGEPGKREEKAKEKPVARSLISLSKTEKGRYRGPEEPVEK